MIVDLQELAKTDDTSIVSHITGEFISMCENDYQVSPDSIAEVARAVECFIENEQDCDYVESRHLVMLASKALSSIGEGEAARRFLLFGSGFVKPSEWEVTGDESMWVIDLKQMTVREDASLELVFFASMHAILETIADVWDVSKGSGTLGLRHVSNAASELLGEGAKKNALESLGNEMKNLCKNKLAQIADDRGWEESPKVMDLDLSA